MGDAGDGDDVDGDDDDDDEDDDWQGTRGVVSCAGDTRDCLRSLGCGRKLQVRTIPVGFQLATYISAYTYTLTHLHMSLLS